MRRDEDAHIHAYIYSSITALRMKWNSAIPFAPSKEEEMNRNTTIACLLAADAKR